MAESIRQTSRMRKTRIVCISDTHNQTPKLPKGDVLIHAGDLTNQGSYSELRKTVEWLEKADYEAKIVIAGKVSVTWGGGNLTHRTSGNHDITLDAEFYARHGSSWRWPEPQNPEECRKLLTNSASITYLEHEAAAIYLGSPDGPHTCFTVFGSPFTPKKWTWAFQYEPQEAKTLWDVVPLDTDIVITHTPPQGHCDDAKEDDRSGCGALHQTLARVRPLINVFGHIHDGRGVERVRWCVEEDRDNGCLEEGVEVWKDPGIGNKKQSLVDVTTKGRQPLANSGVLTCQPDSQSLVTSCQAAQDRGQPAAPGDVLPDIFRSTFRPVGITHSEAKGRAKYGGAIECRHGRLHVQGDIGVEATPDVVEADSRRHRRETVMINAAFMGRRGKGPQSFNKPIVVDIDLPVWGC